jgi:membrane-bound metal-dependent hydrolase YbcI (DUF457 family)
MPQAVTHVLIALIAADVIRDYVAKKKFSLYLVLLGGIAGLLPDIDYIAYWILNPIMGLGLSEVHRQFTHTLLVPIAFLALMFIFKKKKIAFIGFGMLALGTGIHLLLDGFFQGLIPLFYPISKAMVGINVLPPGDLGRSIVMGADAILLVGWLIHEVVKHRIKDFI